MIKIKLLKAKLFWKILFWFWLSFVLVFVINLIILQVSSTHVSLQELPPHLIKQVATSKERIEKYFEKGKNLKRIEHPRYFNIYLLSSDGTDRFGKVMPKLVLTLDQYRKETQQLVSVVNKARILFGGMTIEVDGQVYRIYISRAFRYFSETYLYSFFQEFVYSILVSMFLISFPLSFLLAWFVVRPIKSLKQATKDISKDITNRKHLKSLLDREDEFADLATDFETMRLQLEQQLSSRIRLISDVSHELRSPLVRMQMAIGIANNKLNKDKQNSELERIKLEADRMNLMLTELLDFTKIDNIQYQQNNEKVSINHILNILINDAKFEAEQVGINIEADIKGDFYIIGNQMGLSSCFENIVRNSIRYAKKNVLVSCHQVNRSDAILITIRDDGDGVPKEDIEHIFGAFYRPELDRSRKSGGVGLGLSIAQKVVSVHSGKIWAENISPRGFAIQIELPTNFKKHT